MSKIIKIANGQGFWGDSVDAPLELINNADIHYLTLDYNLDTGIKTNYLI